MFQRITDLTVPSLTYLHVVGRGQAGDQHLAAFAGLLDGLGSAGERDGTDAEDALEIGMGLHEILCDLERERLIFIAGLGRDELELGVLRQPLVHELDPFVLVGGGERGGDDRDFAPSLARTCAPDVLGHRVDERVADVLGGGLVDEELRVSAAGRRHPT